MRSFEENLEKFNARGVRIVGISVDPPEVTRKHCEKLGYTYTFLSDPQAEVIRRYDLLHPQGAMGHDISRPAEFLIDPGGAVRWVNLSEDVRVRARPEQVLKLLDGLGVSPQRPA